MGVESFPVVEGEDPVRYLVLPIEWKWLSDCMTSDTLNVASNELGLVPLGDFYSYSRQDALDSLSEEDVEEYEQEAEETEDGFYLGGGLLWLHEHRWSNPEHALATTRGLLKYLEDNPEQPDDERYDAEGFASILQALENVLVEAQANNKRFYITST
jgi:hypothetical protein